MIRLRLKESLLHDTLRDLRRPHPFAYERIGYLACKQSASPQGLLLLAYKYLPIVDEWYVRDEGVGARFDANAIRAGMQLALTNNDSIFHVHVHEHNGVPRMSRVDIREMENLMPCFVNVCPRCVHGAIVLSADRAYGRVWGTELSREGCSIDRITAISDQVRLLS